MRIRLLPFQVADGPWNMAADESLLGSAAAGAVLRFYGWSSPTLSLGYFQPSAPALAHPHLTGLPWLRRPTGGAALVHHHELTYALALPPGAIWQPAGVSWLCRMHEQVRTVLAGLGIAARLCSHEHKSAKPQAAERQGVPSTVARPSKRDGPRGEVLCFLHHTPGDLLLGSCKIAGSAQRKQRRALLQHGGILLARSPFTPTLPGIAELTGLSLDAEPLAALLIEGLSRQGFIVERGDWAPDERQRRDALLPRYTSAAWNGRR